MLPALFDGVKSLPAETVAALHLDGVVAKVGEILPLSDIGMDWVVPSVLGFVVGLIFYALKKDKGTANA